MLAGIDQGVMIVGIFDDNAYETDIIGYAYTSTNATTNMTLTLPAGTTINDTIYLMIVYENNTTDRPTISGFTELASRNGTFANSASTNVLMVGNDTTSVTVPNNATYNGGNVSCIVLKGNYSNSGAAFATSPEGSSVGVVMTTAKNQFGLFLAGLDHGTDTTTSWTMDADHTTTDTYFQSDGAVAGRGGAVATRVGEGTSITYTLYDDSATSSGASWAHLIATKIE